jgi:hypothetical protein
MTQYCGLASQGRQRYKKITKKSNNNIERMNEGFIIITKIAIPGPIIPVASGEFYSR